MDDSLNFTLPPASLTQMCTAKITVSMLYPVLENQSAMAVFDSEKLMDIKNQLLDNLKEIKLSKKMKNLAPYLRNYLIFVLSELQSWYKDFSSICYSISKCKLDTQLTKQVLNNIVWTVRGQVNAEETAQNFIEAGIVSLNSRFRLACTFYFEPLVRRLWSELGSENQKTYENQVQSSETFEIIYWVYEMRFPNRLLPNVYERLFYGHTVGKKLEDIFNETSTRRPYVYGLAYSLLENKFRYSARYFSTMCDEREKLAVFKAIGLNLADELAFHYFSFMNQDTLEHLFKIDPNNVFKVFDNLPIDIFLRIFRVFKPKMVIQHIFQVLLSIAHRKIREDDGYVSPLEEKWGEVFREIWENEMDALTRGYVRNLSGFEKISVVHLVSTLHENGHIDSATLVLQQLNQNQRIAVGFDVMRNKKRLQFNFFETYSCYFVTTLEDLEYFKSFITTELAEKKEWMKLIVSLERNITRFSRKRKA